MQDKEALTPNVPRLVFPPSRGTARVGAGPESGGATCGAPLVAGVAMIDLRWLDKVCGGLSKNCLWLRQEESF